MESLKNGEYYVGSAGDFRFRLKQHNSGNVKATQNKRPYKIVFSQEFDSRLIAEKIERKIKNWKRKDFIERIIKDGEIKCVGA